MEGDRDKNLSPFFFEKNAFKWLNAALDCGISEAAYWDMTIAELCRAVESRNRVRKEEEREKAMFDYILANAIGQSVARIYSSSCKMPRIYELYPSLFDEEQEQQTIDELSSMRFRQFVEAHNKKYIGGAAKNGK